MASIHQSMSRRYASPFLSPMFGGHEATLREAGPGWNWDVALQGFIATASVNKFSCTECGEEHPVPSYGNCKCGKIWNAYVISANGKGTHVVREVPRREGVVMASARPGVGRRTASAGRRDPHGRLALTDPIFVGDTGTVEAYSGSRRVGSLTWFTSTASEGRVEGPAWVVRALRARAADLAPGYAHGRSADDLLHCDAPQRTGGRTARFIEARYPTTFRDDAPYGHIPLPEGVHGFPRARNRPASVPGVDPEDIEFVRKGNEVSAYHPETGELMGSYSWSGDTIHVAKIAPKYQGIGLSGALLDNIRENHVYDLKHSDELSYQGRAGALRDLGNTESEFYDYLHTVPYNHGSPTPTTFGLGEVSPEQQAAHNRLMDEFEEDVEEFDIEIETYEFGYDENGDYVGEDGEFDSEGYDHDGYDSEGRDRDGYDSDGFDEDGYDEYGYDSEGYDEDGFDEDGLNADGFDHRDVNSLGEDYWGYSFDEEEAEGPSMDDSYENHSPGQTSLPYFPAFPPSDPDVEVYRAVPSGDDSGDRIGVGDALYLDHDQALEVARNHEDPSQDMSLVQTTVPPSLLRPTEDGSGQATLSIEDSPYTDQGPSFPATPVPGTGLGQASPDMGQQQAFDFEEFWL